MFAVRHDTLLSLLCDRGAIDIPLYVCFSIEKKSSVKAILQASRPETMSYA